MSATATDEIVLRLYDMAVLGEFLGDRVAYRNLAPCDPQLDGLERVGPQVGLPSGSIPRKSHADYARVVTHILRQARSLQAGERNSALRPLRRLIFVGDTRLLDGTAFTNLCAAGDWPGLAFIGSENTKPAELQVVSGQGGRRLVLSNRWAGLAEFDRFCAAEGLAVDEDTVVVVDLDKTALGARGRNAAVIDAARVEAVQQTVAGLLGDAFDLDAFRRAYEPLNQPEFHTFTGDNQDYLAYICLMLGAGLDRLDTLVAAIRAGEMDSFDQFICLMEQRKSTLPENLSAIHGEIFTNMQAGDPTPFKAFRRREYLATQKRFGWLPTGTPLERLLREEILITQEVRAMALEWAGRGALLFGLSDKPDEAAVPTSELAAQGYRPLHQTPTHAVGV